MPELPEVEFARRSLVRWFDAHRLVRAEADRKARTFRGAKVADFEKLSGRLASATRRGKYLLLAFSSGQGLVAHLGMTGKFVLRKQGEVVPYSRARFVLDTGDVIHFRDPRLFGRIEPAPASKLAQVEAVAKLGLDPLVDGLSPAQLEGAIGRSKQDLKVALMDQERLAGLGNIHAAEALFRAGLHPARKPASLSKAEWAALAKAIRDGIRFALEVEGGDDEIEYVEEPGAENPFLVYGRAGEPCPKCGTTVKAFTQGGRTTHFCPSCQPKRPASEGRPTSQKKQRTKRSTR
ncbi:MAG: bifunctional DNA-formamidopyrimidine glycosylase/DNA-(apurinic or apyrimidinic site) lyase [Myxococcota bacterium]